MCVGVSLLPVGLMQTWASVHHGYWMRVPGDSLFAIGAFILVTFVFTLKSRRSKKEAISPDVVLVSAGD